jgi:hypothetical protein
MFRCDFIELLAGERTWEIDLRLWSPLHLSLAGWHLADVIGTTARAPTAQEEPAVPRARAHQLTAEQGRIAAARPEAPWVRAHPAAQGRAQPRRMVRAVVEVEQGPAEVGPGQVELGHQARAAPAPAPQALRELTGNGL